MFLVGCDERGSDTFIVFGYGFCSALSDLWRNWIICISFLCTWHTIEKGWVELPLRPKRFWKGMALDMQLEVVMPKSD